MSRVGLAVALWLFGAGCVVAPRDPLVAGEAAQRGDDLLTALCTYDAVPPSDPRHAEARAGAVAIELRLRRAQELMLDGMMFRGQHLDAEALQRLEQARELWPGLHGVDALIAATRRRLTMPASSLVSLASANAPAPLPVPPVAEVPVAVPAPITAIAASEPASAPAVKAAPAPEAPPNQFVDPASESVVLGLVAVEARLGRGELELAVVDLLELARRFPGDVRVQRRLARVLHQRALLRYGQGALQAALLDWERVLSIEPDNREVAGLLRTARAEASAPAAPSR